MIEQAPVQTATRAIDPLRPTFALKLPQMELKLPPPAEVSLILCQPPVDGPTPVLPKCEVTHLGQLHSVPGRGPEGFVDDVVASQLEIVRFLRKNRDTEVVLEGLTEDMTPALHKEMSQKEVSMVSAAKAIFPKGIPDCTGNLDVVQREFLYEVGAASAMWYLGELAELHRAIAPATSEKIDADVLKRGYAKYGDAMGFAVAFDKELKELIFDKREAAAFAEVETLRKSGAKKITLIFGAAHEFARFASPDNALTVTSVSTVPPPVLPPGSGKRTFEPE